MRDETRERMRWTGPDGGSGCTNDDCDAGGTVRRVLSTREIEETYRTPAARDALPFAFPLPDDVEYACTRCGWFYTGLAVNTFVPKAREIEALPFEPSDYDVLIDREAPPGVNVKRLVEAVPDGTSQTDVVAVALRRIPGASADLVERVFRESTRDDLVQHPADEFM